MYIKTLICAVARTIDRNKMNSDGSPAPTAMPVMLAIVTTILSASFQTISSWATNNTLKHLAAALYWFSGTIFWLAFIEAMKAALQGLQNIQRERKIANGMSNEYEPRPVTVDEVV